MLEPIICPTCGKEFVPKQRRRKYCSQACYHKQPVWNKGTKGLQKAWNRQDLYATCEYCGKEFKITLCRVATARFCSRTCQNKWLGKKHKENIGSKNPGFKNGSSAAYYRREAFRLYGLQCQRCGSTEKLVVHHKDGNRNNNPLDGSNWEVLCKQCHQIIHDCTSKLPKRVSRKKELELKLHQRYKCTTCIYCETEFHPTHTGQKFCSRACYHHSRRKRN